MAANKERLDVALVRRGLARGRERARALIMAGQVLVANHLVDKPGTLISLEAECRLKEAPDELKYVSRGGLKLEKALATFGLNPAGLIALDVGASTGGFTDCLLQHGAKRVYAIDVGQGQLAWTLRNDPRVVVMEHVNIRHLTSLPEPIQCATIDVSFISLRLALPVLVPLLAPGAWVVALVKPQFEAGRDDVGSGGIVRDPAIHRRVLVDTWAFFAQTVLRPQALAVSPIKGGEGNTEFLMRLALGGTAGDLGAALASLEIGA
jgi:23S rRNA (cytidine1920-2'-O)/16S rRNA (cytidine1409-2'-O)-methyltransferase